MIAKAVAQYAIARGIELSETFTTPWDGDTVYYDADADVYWEFFADRVRIWDAEQMELDVIHELMFVSPHMFRQIDFFATRGYGLEFTYD
jgi:hypothetical protein